LTADERAEVQSLQHRNAVLLDLMSLIVGEIGEDDAWRAAAAEWLDNHERIVEILEIRRG
jgi:hypothetical protein